MQLPAHCCVTVSTLARTHREARKKQRDGRHGTALVLSLTPAHQHGKTDYGFVSRISIREEKSYQCREGFEGSESV